MPLPGSLVERLALHLSRHLGTDVDIELETLVGGGSINDSYRLDTNEGPFFVKVNSAERYPALFEAEADDLQRLRKAGVLRVPEVIAQGEDHDDGYLLLEHLTAGKRSASFWEDFGLGLARLHGHTAEHFGLDRPNYIGTLRQMNTPDPAWVSFLIHHRLEPLVKRACDKRKVEAGMALRFERLYTKLDGLFPKEPPALLHGDLWSGNFLTGRDGAAALIDPAVYYGHREMDLAMTKLFGGFEDAFYGAYTRERPLEQGWEERVDLCNLYPLLVHLNLFGGNYIAQVEAVLRRFV